jgi:hypothetical protein
VPPFDVTLTDPAPAAVARAMAEAVETANRRCTVGLMRADPAAHARFLDSEFAAREGVAPWLSDKGRVDTFPPTPRGTLLAVAWHTTALGRRLVRVAGRRIEPFKEGPDHRFGPPWRQLPPLCHLDADHVVTRTFTGGDPETIALCDCGAVGPPEKLAWVGGRCGPCHDHLEEHGTPLAGGPVALRTAGQLIAVGFLPSGRTVAAAEWSGDQWHGTVRPAAWDRRTGACRTDERDLSRAAEGEAVAPSPAGLALSDGYPLFWFDDTGRGPALRLPVPPSCVSMTFQGTTATAAGYNGAGWRRDLTAAGEWAPLWPERRRGRDIIYSSVAVAPGGTKVALGRTDCAVELFDLPGSDGPMLQPVPGGDHLEFERVYRLAFSPDGKLLAAGAGTSGFVTNPREEWRGRGGGLYLYDAVKGEFLAGIPTTRDDILAVAFSPDGSLLFFGSTDCTVRVLGVGTRQEVAVLSGHVGGVNALAFSPDGTTLASAGGDGLVRLWPWRTLLERPENPSEPTAKKPSARPARKRKR